ncbi:ATP-binding cassette domain-containing protein [Candidatus Avelusimicrobium faecicola]|uniref:ABC transporter ATP-binding protein n=1 Tax=Candidatus Avelusimicrobium faecicola TaxID=3416205 RepID=UPI0015A00955|nr:ABC transporter ATP-binding protein [Spirochaetota bacterium]MCI7536189.1 ABC transporter ATP-binding protein [Spirochaetota bacterium]MDY2939467.1 ABC transporter ATP-binding protein [Elusimicrobiaceae bacterium]
MDNIIELKNVTKIYGQKDENLCVLEDVSLQVQKGRFVVLLGPSGSGKSTLLNLIAMLDKPTSGQIFFEGQDITRLRKESARSALRLKKMGFVFQFDGLLPEFSLLENVELPALMRGDENPQKAQALLENLGLGAITHKLPSELSGGEKQRASIARALRNEPVLLLADEPTGNLDASRKEQVFKDFARMAREGLTVLMVTHDVHAVNFADDVYTLENRKLVKTK